MQVRYPPQEMPVRAMRAGSTPGWARSRLWARRIAATLWYVQWSAQCIRGSRNFSAAPWSGPPSGSGAPSGPFPARSMAIAA
jgi:hypothetical protein